MARLGGEAGSVELTELAAAAFIKEEDGMRLRMLKYGAAAAAISLMTLGSFTPAYAVNTPAPAVNTPAPAVNTPAPAVNTPAYAVNTPAPAVNTYLNVFQNYNYTGSGCCGYNYLCASNTHYLNLVAPIKSLKNNCSVRIWFRQNYGGSPGYNHCYNAGQHVAYNSSTYWYPNYIYMDYSGRTRC
jgi:hypothetical protein